MGDYIADKLRIGFMRLSDAAPIIIAKEKGFFAQNGLDVELSRERSWAVMRDKLAGGRLQAGHVLAPMVPASWLANTFSTEKFVTAFSINLNGNGITVSKLLYQQIQEQLDTAPYTAKNVAKALKSIIRERILTQAEALKIGVVFPYSSHNYAMRYWLASEGIDPDRDVRILVSNPDQLVEEMRNGKVDVFCVGEPWNTIAIAEDVGYPILRSRDIWTHMPEKVLAVGHGWAQQNPKIHRAMVKSLLLAVNWLTRADHLEEAIDILASTPYLGLDVGVIASSLLQRTGPVASNIMEGSSSLIFQENHANFPWRSHALWFLTQMARWGQIDQPIDARTIVEHAYLPEVYRDVANELNIPYPEEDYRLDGARSNMMGKLSDDIEIADTTFFDGHCFNPRQLTSYMESFMRHNFKIDLQDFGWSG
jgi:nitrate/nitrite transport system substrate-binding protein